MPMHKRNPRRPDLALWPSHSLEDCAALNPPRSRADWLEGAVPKSLWLTHLRRHGAEYALQWSEPDLDGSPGLWDYCLLDSLEGVKDLDIPIGAVHPRCKLLLEAL